MTLKWKVYDELVTDSNGDRIYGIGDTPDAALEALIRQLEWNRTLAEEKLAAVKSAAEARG